MSPRRAHLRLTLGPQTPPEGWPTREPGPADSARLAELVLAAFAGTVDTDGSETLADALAELDRTFAGAYGEYLAPCSALVESGGHLTGACLITLWKGLPLVAFVMVAPAHQGRGLGAFLIRRSAAALYARGYACLDLAVTDGNLPAQRLYARLGFVEVTP